MFLQASLGRTNLPSAGIGLCHVTADARSIPQAEKTVPLWYPTISNKELFLVGNATRLEYYFLLKIWISKVVDKAVARWMLGLETNLHLAATLPAIPSTLLWRCW